MEQFKKNLGKVSITPEGVWDRHKSFDKLSVVYDNISRHAFLSKTNVPAGVDINDSRYWMPLNVSGYSDSNFIIFSDKDENLQIKGYTLEEAIKAVSPVGRKPGCVISFYNNNIGRADLQGRWEVWQFNSVNIYEWENTNKWADIYTNYDKFFGWFANLEDLIESHPYPEVGCYAYVGEVLKEAVVYRCDKTGEWINTEIIVKDYTTINIDGNITIGDNGNWWCNGRDTGFPVNLKGDPGDTPIFRNNNNQIEYSFDNVQWNPISDKIAAWFKWNNENIIQISRDGQSWTNLSSPFEVNIRMSGYVSSTDELPTNVPVGTLYGVKDRTYTHDNPKYRVYVYTNDGWIDNGLFYGISVGIVQTIGESTDKVMSQHAVTLELESIKKGNSIEDKAISWNKLSDEVKEAIEKDEGITEIVDGSVTTSKIKDGAVTSDKLDDSSVTTNKLYDSSVTSSKINASAVTTDKIENSAITSAKIADSSIIESKINTDAVTTSKIADGAVNSNKIKDGAITSDKLANGAITSDKLPNGVITEDKIADGAITAEKVSGLIISGDKLSNGSITSDKLANDAITPEKISNDAVTTSKIKDAAITTDKVTDSAITSAKIANDAITSDKIKNGNVSTGKLADGSVTETKIADGAVTVNKVADGAITSAKLTDAAVTGIKIANDVITATKLVDGAITYAKLEQKVKDILMAASLHAIQPMTQEEFDNLVSPLEGAIYGIYED